MKRVAWALVFVVACGSVQHGSTPQMHEVTSDRIGVFVTAEGGTLPIFFFGDQYYLLGKKGSRYEVGLANRTEARVEVVVSVDGRDVITGQVADFRKNRGYVLLPGEKIRIEGFRRSLDEVAAFEFCSPEDAYAARMGDQQNVGVIGIAVFEEEPPPKSPQKIAIGRESPAPPDVPNMIAEADSAKEEESGLGTKYGETVGSAAEIVAFRRLDREQPQELIALYYDDRAGLEGLGIIIPDDSLNTPAKKGPDPFPGVQKEEAAFAPPPPR